MKTLAQSLPAGLPREPTPADFGRGTQIPTPGDARTTSPGAAVCPFCAEHFPLVEGSHYRVAFRKETLLGVCTAPKRATLPEETPQPRLTHLECQERLARIAASASTSRVLAEARETYATHSEPKEDDDDSADER